MDGEASAVTAAACTCHKCPLTRIRSSQAILFMAKLFRAYVGVCGDRRGRHRRPGNRHAVTETRWRLPPKRFVTSARFMMSGTPTCREGKRRCMADVAQRGLVCFLNR